MAVKAKYLVEAARGAALAAHSAAGLADAASVREAARLLRSSEALARAAVSVLAHAVALQGPQRQDAKPVVSGAPPPVAPVGPPGGSGGRRRRRRSAKKTKQDDMVVDTGPAREKDVVMSAEPALEVPAVPVPSGVGGPRPLKEATRPPRPGRVLARQHAIVGGSSSHRSPTTIGPGSGRPTEPCCASAEGRAPPSSNADVVVMSPLFSGIVALTDKYGKIYGGSGK